MTTAITKRQPEEIVGMMAKFWPESVGDFKRFEAMAVSVAVKDKALTNCTMASKLLAVAECARLGLVPDKNLGHVYLVPYGKTATMILGYKGLIELARRSGQVRRVFAQEVYDNDDFSVNLGSGEPPDHRPWWQPDTHMSATEPGEIIAAYCVATMATGETMVEVVPRGHIDAIRNRSKAGGSGPWKTDFAIMARKTAVRRASKMWPLSPELGATLARAVRVDERAEEDRPQFDPSEMAALDEAPEVVAEAEVVSDE